MNSFSFLHRIRYAARSAGTKDAVRSDEITFDHVDFSDNGTALDSGGSADMVTTRSHLRQAFTHSRSTPDCVLTLATVRNDYTPVEAISQCEQGLL